MAWVRALLARCVLLGALVCGFIGLAACAGPQGPGKAPPPVERVGKTPDWVENGGRSRRFPDARYLTGFAMEVGETPLDSAKRKAAADLSERISVRIEHELRDVSVEQNGVYTYKIAAVLRSTSDIRLSGLDYDTWVLRGDRGTDRVYALAVLERGAAVARRRGQRERALVAMRTCMASAERHERAGRVREAVDTYETCRRPITEALEHDAVVRAVAASGSGSQADRAALQEVMEASQRIDERIAEIFRRPASSLRDSVESLALQLSRQGVSGSASMTVAPFTYGTADLSSEFGRQASQELEGALARQSSRSDGGAAAHLAVRGFYLEQGDELQLSVTAKEAESGKTVAHAETRLARSAVPAGLALKPANFEKALQDQKVLAAGELVEGDLRVELWTDKGKRGLLYNEAEELKLYVRVNQPCWIRLIYVLQSGLQVPIVQAYRIDASKVNFVIEYPESFEVVPPFGVEHIYATAFTDEPPLLATRQTFIDGQVYEVVAGGMQSLVKTRGIRRKQKIEMAESFVTVTTTPGE